MADEEDLHINASAYVTKLNVNDISSDDEPYSPIRSSPAIAPMQLGRTQPLKRRFFSTGAKRNPKQHQQNVLQQHIRDQELNKMVFANKNTVEPPFEQIRPPPIPTRKQRPENVEDDKVSQLVNDISTSEKLKVQTTSTMRRLTRSKPQSGHPINKERLYCGSTTEPPPTEPQVTRSICQTAITQLLNESSDDAAAQAAVPVQQSHPAAGQRVFTRTNKLSRSQSTKDKANALESSYKYKELQNTAQFTKIQRQSEQVQNQFKNQFKVMQKSVAQSPKPRVLKMTHSAYNPEAKVYNQQVVDEIFPKLDPSSDWAVRDKALKELAAICRTQPHILLEYSDLAEFFRQCPRLLVDLRSALVTQTLDTLKTVYETYANLDYLSKHQLFIVQLFKKAGNPSLADFMVQQADAALLLANINILSTMNYNQCGMQQLLQALSTEMRSSNAPGVRFRICYFITDLLIIAFHTLGGLQEMSTQVMGRYSLEWTDRGLAYVLGDYQIENTIGEALIQQKMVRQLASLQGFVNEMLQKHHTDANPEMRRCMRRLYYVARCAGICTEKYQKMDEFIEKEGVADTWWGR